MIYVDMCKLFFSPWFWRRFNSYLVSLREGWQGEGGFVLPSDGMSTR